MNDICKVLLEKPTLSIENYTKLSLEQSYFVYLSDLSLLNASGKNSLDFLQGQLSCNLNDINEHTSQKGAYCDHQGRIIANFLCLQFAENDYGLSLLNEILPTTLAELKKFAVFSKVDLAVLDKQWLQLGIVGKLPDNLAKLLDENPMPNKVISQANFKLLTLTATHHLLIIQAEFLQGLLKEWLASDNWLANDYWHYWQIQQGWAQITTSTQHLFTPHDLNYQKIGAVNFKKGCYRGQEIIARMHYRGNLKKATFYAKVKHDSLPIPKQELLTADAKICGYVINATQLADNKYELLAVVNEKAKESGAVFLKESEQPLIFLDLPYEKS